MRMTPRHFRAPRLLVNIVTPPGKAGCPLASQIATRYERGTDRERFRR